MLPMCEKLLKPAVVDTDSAVRLNQQRQAHYYNRGAKALIPLQKGEQVRVQSQVGGHTFWIPASVLRQDQNRSYTVKMETGTVLRRNRRHLRPSPGGLPTKETDSRSLPVTPPVGGGHNAPQPHTPATPAPQATQDVVTTRCGRVVRRPAHLRDFV